MILDWEFAKVLFASLREISRKGVKVRFAHGNGTRMTRKARINADLFVTLMVYLRKGAEVRYAQ